MTVDTVLGQSLLTQAQSLAMPLQAFGIQDHSAGVGCLRRQ